MTRPPEPASVWHLLREPPALASAGVAAQRRTSQASCRLPRPAARPPGSWRPWAALRRWSTTAARRACFARSGAPVARCRSRREPRPGPERRPLEAPPAREPEPPPERGRRPAASCALRTDSRATAKRAFLQRMKRLGDPRQRVRQATRARSGPTSGRAFASARPVLDLCRVPAGQAGLCWPNRDRTPSVWAARAEGQPRRPGRLLLARRCRSKVVLQERSAPIQESSRVSERPEQAPPAAWTLVGSGTLIPSRSSVYR